jgi:hypothetical protein
MAERLERRVAFLQIFCRVIQSAQKRLNYSVVNLRLGIALEMGGLKRY